MKTHLVGLCCFVLFGSFAILQSPSVFGADPDSHRVLQGQPERGAGQVDEDADGGDTDDLGEQIAAPEESRGKWVRRGVSLTGALKPLHSVSRYGV